MWIKKSCILYVKVKVKRVGIPFIIPLRIFWELVEAVEDILRVFVPFSKGNRARAAVRLIKEAVREMAAYGRYDFVDVSADKAVEVKIGVR